ncbi:hypothetical protein CapIbe_013444 [Capra ibex]
MLSGTDARGIWQPCAQVDRRARACTDERPLKQAKGGHSEMRWSMNARVTSSDHRGGEGSGYDAKWSTVSVTYIFSITFRAAQQRQTSRRPSMGASVDEAAYELQALEMSIRLVSKSHVRTLRHIPLPSSLIFQERSSLSCRRDARHVASLASVPSSVSGG